MPLNEDDFHRHDHRRDDQQHHGHHHHSSELHGGKLLYVTVLNLIITIAEILGGIFSNSLSLISDAIHNLGDTLALLFAFIANKVGNRKADIHKTFGYKRVEIITAFFNSLVLVIICLFLFREAYLRLIHPEPIKGLLMLVVAIVGLIANWISVLILQNDKDKNINVKAAYLHLLGDTLSSVAVIAGGIFIYFFNVTWVDPVVTIAVGIYIIYHSWSVLMESVYILMQAAPKWLDTEKVIEEIEKLDEVKSVHHLHLWQLNDSQVHFEAHIVLNFNYQMSEVEKIRNKINQILEKHKIRHSTLQFESESSCGHENQLIVDENLS